MLKNKSLLAVLIFAAVASVGNGYVAFAENDTSSIALNDDPQEKKVETQTLENSDNEPSEVGVSGSYLSSLFSRSNGDIESAIKSLKTVYHKTRRIRMLLIS